MSQHRPSNLFASLSKHYRSLKRVCLNLQRGAEMTVRFVEGLVALFAPIVFSFMFVFGIVEKVGKVLSRVSYLPLRSRTHDGDGARTSEAAETDGEWRRDASVSGVPNEKTTKRNVREAKVEKGDP
ncbi:uncharacterized protein LOC122254266 [Penaeus japonicus]|uniref:uncharacterized protein LOC122254266 n=1 Tax=Penaeus japonicus TaxID=27405 RepID=UPI001C710D1C|nr:uncharacterized protein LOC122254266 [Penaeus japonicus]XP_042873790.1 uncharacterized protein LOC122254266 [Penaeus japonicus]XP_042873791.1 uncharacterized protein LOC122254266 [Penaeus japonicus]XP_042873792.1 uncharacterized protein LOC122254266 [Penaeus japonicus]XP_042873793.1 uncharacterized protein LOC122254266 [Penaeus japonicus]XP_042873794.1 uncharacterized protein LOC122254266 [Penaeus japonicus]XP_042873795.1 uncharacterized protein LOC122254266 [Penaeus japonicus]XP_04287379